MTTSEQRDILSCDHLVVGYRKKALLPPISLAIQRGRLVLVVGRNGAGKSTWLKTVLGLMPPVGGKVRLGTSAERPRIAYVPQQARLDELLPVRASTVIGWGQLRGWDFLRPFATRAEQGARKRAMEQAEVMSFAAQPFRDLSGGQRQRVLFARLLVSATDLAVLDEPTASMDMASEKRAYERMASLAHEHDMAVLVVTHTIGAAALHADDVLFVDRGEGHRPDEGMVAFGPPAEVFAHPQFKHHFGEVAHGD